MYTINLINSEFEGEHFRYIEVNMGGRLFRFDDRKNRLYWSNAWSDIIEAEEVLGLKRISYGPNCYGHTEYELPPELVKRATENPIAEYSL